MTNLPPIRVLLVDDEPTLLDVFSNYLRFSGFEVFTAYDGVDALEQIVKVKPEIVVLDIKMPRMDGWEACQKIKENPITCGIPVVFLTAFDQQQDRERAKRLNVQGYVTKPCEPSNLIQILQNIVRPVLPTK